MKRKINLFVLGLVIVNFSFAQNKNSFPDYIGIKAGLSIPNLLSSSNDPLSKGFKSRLGLDAGAFIELPFNKHFSFQTGLSYSEQGGKRNGYQAIRPNTTPAGSYDYSDVKNTNKFNYLLLPIQLKYKVAVCSKTNFYAAAGFFGGYLLSAKNVLEGDQSIDIVLSNGVSMPTGQFMSNNTQNIYSNIHKFNVGFIAAVGFEYITSMGKWFVEGGGNYGFIPIQIDATNGKNNIGAGTVSLGYAMKLK